MENGHHPPKWQTLLAFGIIYFVWGATFFAIRVGVHEVPPLLFCAMRFVTAGLIVFAWAITHKETPPSMRQWMSAILLAFLIFVVDYGFLFWAEQRVPSGIAAVIMATIPAFMALAEILILGTQRLTIRLSLALISGIAGVALLMSRSINLGILGKISGAPIDRAGAAGLIVAAMSWGIASSLGRKLPLPASKVMSSGAQMLAGGVMLLAVSGACGEWRGFHLFAISSTAWIALAYLVFAGSIAGFTAYVWLLHHESPTKIGTYAYVNPIVAVIIGYFLGGEPLGPRTVIGGIFILASVLTITTMRAKSPAVVEEAVSAEA